MFAHNVSNTPGAGYSGSSGDGGAFFGLVFGAILDTATNPANYRVDCIEQAEYQ